MGGTTTSMLAEGEVIKNVGCNVFFFFFPAHSFEEVLTLEWTSQSDYTTSMWESENKRPGLAFPS